MPGITSAPYTPVIPPHTVEVRAKTPAPTPRDSPKFRGTPWFTRSMAMA